MGTKSRRVKISAIDVASVTAPFTFMRPPQLQISGLIPRDLNMSWVARIQRLVSEVSDAADSLQHFAERGRKVPEFSDSSIRELLIRNYRLIYKIKSSQVLVLTFIHGARRL